MVKELTLEFVDDFACGSCRDHVEFTMALAEWVIADSRTVSISE